MSAWGDDEDGGAGEGDPEEDDPEAGPGPDPEAARASLAERFLIPPFSVLDQRQGYWQSRKRSWLALGIKSELGRGGNLLELSDSAEDYRQREGDYARGSKGNGPARTFGQDLMKGEHVVGQKVQKGGVLFKSDSGRDPGFYKQKRTVEARLGRELTTEEFQRDYYVNEAENGLSGSGTSVFDPVLCEIAYRWWSPPSGRVLDPFAGGSVRGVVAALTGRQYVGIELSGPQVAANRVQAEEIVRDAPPPTWITGDSSLIPELLADDPEPFDFVFSCPPYADLEVYSDDPRDLSTMDYDAFLTSYREIIRLAVERLADDRFACFVVGDVRDRRGLYRNFVSDTIAAFQDAGAMLYNEAILVTPVGSLPIRVGKQMEASRKLGKTHQNVLVFVKGDPKRATEACGPVAIEELTAAIEDSDLAGPGPEAAPDAVGDDDDFARLAAARFEEEADE